MKLWRLLVSLSFVLVALFGQPGVAEAGWEYCRDHQDPICPTPTPVEATEIPSTESTPTETPPTPAPTETPTSTPEPTQPPQGASCTLSSTTNNEGWVVSTITYGSGPRGEGIWWVLRYQTVESVGKQEPDEWAGWDGWDTSSEGEISHTMGMVFAPGDYIFRVDVLGSQEGACSESVGVPYPPPPSIPEPIEDRPEERDEVTTPLPTLLPGPSLPGCTSPDGWYRCWQEDGEIWVEDGTGLTHSSGVSGTNPTWLGNWAILAYHPDGSVFLTDMWGSFIRELRVVGNVTSVSIDGEWVKFDGGEGLRIVSIHGARFGEGPVDSPIFAYIVFPNSSGP